MRVGVIAGWHRRILMLFPTGDGRARTSPCTNRSTLAAMEGLFHTARARRWRSSASRTWKTGGSTIRSIVPNALSFLTYRRWNAEVKGLNAFPRDQWPDNIALLYLAITSWLGWEPCSSRLWRSPAVLLWRGRLYRIAPAAVDPDAGRAVPYIANTAGWTTAELGRQPWLVYGLMRTSPGLSPNVSAANGLFTLIGFMGLYLILGILFLFLVSREVAADR